MKEECPKCKAKEIIDLTEDVEDNENFTDFFKAHVYCPSCETYMFIGDKSKLEAFDDY